MVARDILRGSVGLQSYHVLESNKCARMLGHEECVYYFYTVGTSRRSLRIACIATVTGPGTAPCDARLCLCSAAQGDPILVRVSWYLCTYELDLPATVRGSLAYITC